MTNINKITDFYAFISIEEGNEKVCSCSAIVDEEKVTVPLVAYDKDRIHLLKPLVQNLVKETGKQIKLISFSNRKELETFEP